MPHNVYQKMIKDLLADESITIPEHQRTYVWNHAKQSALIDTIMEGLPTHALFLYQHIVDGRLNRDLEDGQQRWMTIKKFVNGEFEWKPTNRKFSDFTPEEVSKFMSYSLTICLMENMSMELRLSLFQRLQDGAPLSNGQRFKAASHLPVVKLANELMTHSCCHEIWGQHKETKGNTVLANAMAIASALAFGSDQLITTSYAILGPVIYKNKDVPVNKEDAEERLRKLLSVYTLADEIYPITNLAKKKQWKVGTYTGYILYTMLQEGRDWEYDREMWANYIVRVRRDEAAIRILRHNAPASRNWSAERWRQGLENVQNPEATYTSQESSSLDDEEEDE